MVFQPDFYSTTCGGAWMDPGMITIVTPKKQVVTTPCGYVIYLYILLFFYPLDCSWSLLEIVVLYVPLLPFFFLAALMLLGWTIQLQFLEKYDST